MILQLLIQERYKELSPPAKIIKEKANCNSNFNLLSTDAIHGSFSDGYPKTRPTFLFSSFFETFLVRTGPVNGNFFFYLEKDPQT